MSQDRISGPTILNIEHELTNQLLYDIIEDLAKNKSRHKTLRL